MEREPISHKKFEGSLKGHVRFVGINLKNMELSHYVR